MLVHLKSCMYGLASNNAELCASKIIKSAIYVDSWYWIYVDAWEHKGMDCFYCDHIPFVSDVLQTEMVGLPARICK